MARLGVEAQAVATQRLEAQRPRLQADPMGSQLHRMLVGITQLMPDPYVHGEVVK